MVKPHHQVKTPGHGPRVRNHYAEDRIPGPLNAGSQCHPHQKVDSICFLLLLVAHFWIKVLPWYVWWKNPRSRVNLSAREADKASFLASTMQAGPTQERCSKNAGKPQPWQNPLLICCFKLVVNMIDDGCRIVRDDSTVSYTFGLFLVFLLTLNNAVILSDIWAGNFTLEISFNPKEIT